MFTEPGVDTALLDSVITKLLTAMDDEEYGSDDYNKMADHLVKLYKAKEIEYNNHLKLQEARNKYTEMNNSADLKREELQIKELEIEVRKRVSPDVWASVAANIAAILLIIGHERFRVITTKAFGFVSKLR